MINIIIIIWLIIKKIINFFVIIYIPFILISWLYVILIVLYKIYFKDYTPLYIEKVEYKPFLPYIVYIFLYIKNINMFISIFYKILNWIINGERPKTSILEKIFIIFLFTFSISKRFIDFFIIFIKVLFETRLPRYYYFLYLLYRYSSIYNKYSDNRIFFEGEFVFINGFDFYNKFYYYTQGRFVRGIHKNILPNGKEQLHSIMYDKVSKNFDH